MRRDRTIKGSIEWAVMAAYADECERAMPHGPRERKAAMVRATERIVTAATTKLDEVRAMLFAEYADDDESEGVA